MGARDGEYGGSVKTLKPLSTTVFFTSFAICTFELSTVSKVLPRVKPSLELMAFSTKLRNWVKIAAVPVPLMTFPIHSQSVPIPSMRVQLPVCPGSIIIFEPFMGSQL